MQHQSNVSLNNVSTTIMKTYTSWRTSRVSSNLFKSFCVAFLFTCENIVRQTIVAEVIRDKYHVIIINNLSLGFYIWKTSVDEFISCNFRLRKLRCAQFLACSGNSCLWQAGNDHRKRRIIDEEASILLYCVSRLIFGKKTRKMEILYHDIRHDIRYCNVNFSVF